MKSDPLQIRPINAASGHEINSIAQGMRKTLIEVLGPDRGTALYSMDWLMNRVRFHLDPQQRRAQIFVATDQAGKLCGHCIVREERDEHGELFGLFSTTYVDPDFRRLGLAKRFLATGEAWMRAQGLHRAATDTGLHNIKLIRLYQQHGYQQVYANHEMLRLEKCLEANH